MTQAAPTKLGHARNRGIVLEDLRIVYVPVPKTACTSILWSLARLAGLKPSRFGSSRGSEVTPSMTVHDMTQWPAGCRLRRRDDDWIANVDSDPSWLVFTVVRDPIARLWSAWQSKLLFREPRFVREFGQETWFPRNPNHSGHVLEDFRTFVDAVVSGTARDAHWLPQTELLESTPLPFNFIGHTEEMGSTMKRLREHLMGERVPTLDRRNEGVLPAPWAVLPSGVRKRAVDFYRSDYEAYGYPLPDDEFLAQKDREDWHQTARVMIPLIDQVIQRNRRVGQLHETMQRATQQLDPE